VTMDALWTSRLSWPRSLAPHETPTSTSTIRTRNNAIAAPPVVCPPGVGFCFAASCLRNIERRSGPTFGRFGCGATIDMHEFLTRFSADPHTPVVYITKERRIGAVADEEVPGGHECAANQSGTGP
jgi:hypothetical protein